MSMFIRTATLSPQDFETFVQMTIANARGYERRTPMQNPYAPSNLGDLFIQDLNPAYAAKWGYGPP